MQAVFQNELGNRITIKLSRAPNIGTTKQLRIEMIGPKSTADNTCTQMEAWELYKLLHQIFGNS